MGWCSGETVSHFLNYCDKGIVYVLWCLVFGAFRIQWVAGLLFGFENWFGKHSLEFWNFCLTMFDVAIVERAK